MPQFESTFEDMRPELELDGLKNLVDVEYISTTERNGAQWKYDG